MRRWYAAGMFVLVVSVVLTALAVTLGRAQPMPERLARWHFNACQLPCWNGITPGVTTLIDATAQVQSLAVMADGDAMTSALMPGQGQLVTWAKASPHDKNVWTLTLETNNGLVPKIHAETFFPDWSADSLMPHLGEVILAFGSPGCMVFDGFEPSYVLPYIADRGSLLVKVRTLDWDAPVWAFVMNDFPSGLCSGDAAHPWRGNMSALYRTLLP